MITLHQLREIFEHQTDLARKFHPIEFANGYTPPTWPVNINSRHGQDRLRQFAWWIAEEFVEFSVAGHSEKPEELADMLHFQVEICLNCGYTADDIWIHQVNRSMDSIPETPINHAWEAFIGLGKAVNLLKKKPWKSTPSETDLPMFKHLLTKSLHSLLLGFNQLGYNAHDLYFDKKKKNEQRIESGV